MGHKDPTWTSPPDYQGHEVNMSGEVRNIQTGKVMQMSVNQSGVRYVSIRNTTLGKYENVTVGHLIASAFKDGQSADCNTVLHLDGDTLNNAADNLMWSQRWHAMQYHREMARPQTGRHRPIKDSLGNVYASARDAAMRTGALPSAIEYAVNYNDNAGTAATGNFVHKVWPGGHIFRSV